MIINTLINKKSEIFFLNHENHKFLEHLNFYITFPLLNFKYFHSKNLNISIMDL